MVLTYGIMKKTKKKGKINMINIAKEMIRDYLYYGYGLKTWLEQDYEIAKYLGTDQILRVVQNRRFGGSFAGRFSDRRPPRKPRYRVRFLPS